MRQETTIRRIASACLVIAGLVGIAYLLWKAPKASLPPLLAIACIYVARLVAIPRGARASQALPRLASLTEQNPNPVVEIDLDGRVRYFNAEARRRFPDVASVGAKHPALGGIEEYMRAFERGRSEPFKREIVVRGVEYQQEIAFFAPGKLVRVFSHDISDIASAKNALRNSEERYRLLFERNLAGVYSVTAEGHVLDCNGAFARMFGFEERDEVLQLSATELYFDATEREQWWAQLREQRALVNSEVRMRRRDGSTMWGLESATLITSETGELVAEGTMIDITDIRRGREAVLQLAAIVESSEDAIIGHNLEGEIVSWNRGARKIFGYTESEVKGRSAALLFTPEQRADVSVFVERIRAGETTRCHETQRQRKDGTRIDVEITSFPIQDSTGTLTGTAVIARDISTRKNLEQQLRQSQKMEAIGRLAGGIAHDFNNILTVIGVQSELLQGQQLAQQHLERIGKIRKSVDRASGLTRQLLAFSRQQVLSPQVIDLNAVVKRTIDMLQSIIGEDIRLITSLDPALGTIHADPVQMEQVIMNLAVNARDAMPKGGKLVIQTGNVDLDESYSRSQMVVQPGRYVMLAVTDNGCGMDAATRARIFEPFFTTKPKGVGTGLGLATVYGIIKQSHGYIWVYSEPGLGTTFKIYLPVVYARSDEEYGDESGGTDARSGSEVVLLAEDDAEVRALAREALLAKGYQLLEACDGEQALSVCATHNGPIDVLLTDVIMPKLSGRELAEKVEVLFPGIRTLYMSGYTDDDILRHGALQPGTAFIQKPFTTAQLARKVRELLDGRRLQARAATQE